MAKLKKEKIPMTRVEKLREELKIALEEEKAEKKKRIESRILTAGKIVLAECASNQSFLKDIMTMIREKGSESEQNLFREELDGTTDSSVKNEPQELENIAQADANYLS